MQCFEFPAGLCQGQKMIRGFRLHVSLSAYILLSQSLQVPLITLSHWNPMRNVPISDPWLDARRNKSESVCARTRSDSLIPHCARRYLLG